VCCHGFDSTARNRSMQVSLALDAVPIIKLLSIFDIVLVVTECADKCPRTGKPLGLHTVEGESLLRMIIISHFIYLYIIRSPYYFHMYGLRSKKSALGPC
jgi:hypothetical protein